MSGVTAPSPNKALVDQANAAVAGLTGDSGGGGSLFGANADVLSKQFDVSGLPGLTSKTNPTGRDILQAFMSAGQSDDQNARNLVSAIEYALYQGRYYGSDMPNLHEVTGKDAAALGRALYDFSNVSAVGATPDGQVKPMSLSQFLTSQAALNAVGGPGAPGSAAQKVQVVRTPNPADVAAEYEKIATNLEGKRPSQAETQAFVRQYVQDYTASVTGATSNRYQQLTAAAQSQQLSGQAPQTAVSYNPATDLAGNLNPNVSQIPTGAGSGNLNPAVQNGGPDPYANPDTPQAANLTDSMATLQQVLAANGATSPDGSSIATAADPESVDTAAENFARNANPTAVHQNDLGNTMNMFLNLITQKMV